MDDTPHHTMTALFDQLGLPSTPEAIATFVGTHRGLPLSTRLFDAAFWSPSQSTFLREELREDGDWALVIDSLNASLRTQPTL